MRTSTELGSIRHLAAAFALVLMAACGGNTSNGNGDTGNPQTDDAGAVDASNPGSPDAGPPDAGDAGPADSGDGGCDGGTCAPTCTTHGDAGVGTPCISDCDCQSGICLSTGICSESCAGTPCTTDADCPTGVSCDATGTCSGTRGMSACPNNSWGCRNDGQRTEVCFCEPTGVDICDGIDNDCNGIIDDPSTAVCQGLMTCTMGGCECPAENLCDLQCVDKQTDAANCGECGHACNAGETCQQGSCTCAGMDCSGANGTTVCINTLQDEQNCGGCNIACASSQECINGSCGPIDREWARWPVPFTQNVYTTTGTEVIDPRTGLTWQASVESTPRMTQTDAITYCQNPPMSLGLSGTGWRLPTLIEQLSIVSYAQRSAGGALADPVFNSPPSEFWTATASATNSTNGWVVDFRSGSDFALSSSTMLAVRCVRDTSP